MSSRRVNNPNISYFHPFGCKFFIHNNGENTLGKFNPKSDEGTFLGYSSTSHEYRTFNKKILSIEESMHVVFYESSTSPMSMSFYEEQVNITSTSAPTKITKQINTEWIIETKESVMLSETSKVHVPREWIHIAIFPYDFIIGNRNDKM